METINIRLAAFEGPLDLLYHLIEKNEIDIYDIPIAALTEQYLAYLDAAEDRDMDGMSEFLLMAATLLEIKSKLLLPKPKAEEEEGPDPREELVQRLLEYKRIKDATETLKEREEEAALVYYKEADASVAKLKEQPPQARKETKEDKVRSSFRSVQKDLFTVGEKMEYIRDMLILHPHEKTAFHTIFRRNAGKMERVVTFLALLELIKQKEVQITQEKNFGEIFISRYDEGGAE